MSAAARVPAHVLFFPAAAAYAATVLPASIATLLGAIAPIPGLAFPAGHAHELLFGFALAAVAGNQLGPTAVRTLALLLGTWLAARTAFLAAPHGLFTVLANAGFAALLAAQLAPRLLVRARKLRNRALPVALLALCASAVAAALSIRLGAALPQRTALLAAILLLALLMLFMGGRIVAPATTVRVQPRLEGALIVAMLCAVAAAALGSAVVAGAACMIAAAVAALRLARWRPWTLRIDAACLAAGYLWLAVGLAAIGVALLTGRHLVSALHLVTVGAMGTLTLNVMALTWLRLARRDPARAKLPVWGTALVALATLLRLAADAVPGERGLLWGAAGCWSAAFALLLLLFARTPRRPRAAG